MRFNLKLKYNIYNLKLKMTQTNFSCNPAHYNFTSDMNYSCIYGEEDIIVARYIDLGIMILSICLTLYCIFKIFKKIDKIKKYDEYAGADGKD